MYINNIYILISASIITIITINNDFNAYVIHITFNNYYILVMGHYIIIYIIIIYYNIPGPEIAYAPILNICG